MPDLSDDATSMRDVRRLVAAFVRDRDWEQFHNAKDLAGAIAIESAELQELFLWQSPEAVTAFVATPAGRARIEEELADILLLCFSLANRLDLDLATIIQAKLAINAAKYPVERARGRADKYTRL